MADRNVLITSSKSSVMIALISCLTVTLLATTTIAGEPVDVLFKSKLDGSDQRYVLVLPEKFDAKNSYSVLVALHGHGADRWQFVKDARDECKAARDTASKHNLIYVAPDYRAKTSWMGPKAEADVVQILTELKEKYRVNKVIVCGGSMGGTGALTFAALHPDWVDGVIAMNGTANLEQYDQFQDAIAESFGGSKQQKPDEYRKRSAELYPERLTMPIAMTTGGKDQVVPPDSVLRLAKTLEQHKRRVKLIHRAEGEHSTTYDDAVTAFEFVMAELTNSESKPGK